MSTLKQFIESADMAVIKIFEASGQFLATYHVVLGDGEELIFPPPSPDKNESIAMVRALLVILEAKRVLFVDEAWAAAASGEEESKKVEAFAAANSLEHWGGRREVIVYMAEDEAEGAMLAYRDILREEGKRPRLGTLYYQSGGVNSGRMLGLLPNKTGSMN